MPERPFDEKIQLKKSYRKKRFDPCGKAIGKPIEIQPKSDQTEYPVKCVKCAPIYYSFALSAKYRYNKESYVIFRLQQFGIWFFTPCQIVFPLTPIRIRDDPERTLTPGRSRAE